MSTFPDFYDPNRIGTLFYPDYAAIAAAASAVDLTPAASDTQKIHLVIIDMQVDFCHSGGSLHVPGSGADIRRLIEFIFHQAERITDITCSLDSHLPHQIFHPAWWVDAHGNHPDPFTLITYDEVKMGKWRPLVDPIWSSMYVKQLEEKAKKVLTIWPYHTMIGSVGNALDPALFSAILWHSLARKTQPTWLTKGAVPQTEHYSIVQPEIIPPGHSHDGKNESFLATLSEADLIFIAGEAESHCVLETVKDLVQEFGGQPEQLGKIYLLQDCTSPVIHPEIDFHGMAQKQIATYAEQGLKIINSTDPWPF